MILSKVKTTTRFIEPPKDKRVGNMLLQYSAVDHDHSAMMLARKTREMKEFLATLHNKSVAK